MRIALLSTIGQECGVAQYCADLASAYVRLGHEVRVFSEQTDQYEDPPGFDVVRSFWRQKFDPMEVAATVMDWKPDAVEMQHEFGIWPDDDATVFLLGEFECPKIVTLHTVPRRPHHEEFLRRLMGHVVVHHPSALTAALYADWHYIPHGVGAFSDVRPTARCVPPVAVMPGFLSPTKGHTEILNAMMYVSGFDLRIIGKPAPGYMAILDDTIKTMGLTHRVSVEPRFLSRAEMRAEMRAADVIVLNTVSDNYSASGQAADCIALGLPSASKAMPIYDQLHGVGFRFGYPAMPGTIPDIEIGATIMAAAETGMPKDWFERMRHLAHECSWEKVAKRRLEIL